MDKFSVTSLAVNIENNRIVKILNTNLTGLDGMLNDRDGVKRGLKAITAINLTKGYLSVDITGLRNETTKKTIWVEPLQ